MTPRDNKWHHIYFARKNLVSCKVYDGAHGRQWVTTCLFNPSGPFRSLFFTASEANTFPLIYTNFGSSFVLKASVARSSKRRRRPSDSTDRLAKIHEKRFRVTTCNLSALWKEEALTRFCFLKFYNIYWILPYDECSIRYHWSYLEIGQDESDCGKQSMTWFDRP